MKKKTMALLLAAILGTVSVAGCGSSGSAAGNADSAVPEESAAEAEEAVSEAESAVESAAAEAESEESAAAGAESEAASAASEAESAVSEAASAASEAESAVSEAASAASEAESKEADAGDSDVAYIMDKGLKIYLVTFLLGFIIHLSELSGILRYSRRMTVCVFVLGIYGVCESRYYLAQQLLIAFRLLFERGVFFRLAGAL